MKDKKHLKLIFDIGILENGVKEGSSRAGIFFTAISVLKELILLKDIDLILYCKASKYTNCKKLLKQKFVNNKFKLITSSACPSVKMVYEKLKIAREQAKRENNFFLKLYVWITLFPLRMFLCFANFLYNIYKFFIYSSTNAFLSSFEEIPKEIKKFNNIKKYTIIYDCVPILLPAYNPMSKKGSWYMKLFESLNKDDYYFAISNSARNDFLRLSPNLDAKKVYTTLLACNENFKPFIGNIEEIKIKYNIPNDKKYIFSLCTLEPRKNLIRAVKCFIQFIKKNKINDLVFVLGGGHWADFISQIEREIYDLGDYKNKIIKAGYIDDNDLPKLYSNAEWFVYTSQYEGFGLPPLEAMSCGCPVITSNNSSLPEVVGNSGVMINYDSDQEHIEAYEKYYYDEKFRKEMAAKGVERSKQFSWTKCVNQMIKVMKENL